MKTVMKMFVFGLMSVVGMLSLTGCAIAMNETPSENLAAEVKPKEVIHYHVIIPYDQLKRDAIKAEHRKPSNRPADKLPPPVEPIKK